jgi:methionyl-tRNA synthetase
MDTNETKPVEEAVQPAVAPTYVSYEDFKKVEARVGKILSAMPVEKSEKLLLLSVDFGEESPRTVVSGIAKHFPEPESLVGVMCAFITNLEPRPLMGHVSQAMILAASTEDGAFSIMRAEGVPAGTKLN